MSDDHPKLRSVDGTSVWDPKVEQELRETFEKAIANCDRIVIFSARRQSLKLIVDATSDTRSPPQIPWLEMLGFMQAKINDWMREMLH